MAKQPNAREKPIDPRTLAFTPAWVAFFDKLSAGIAPAAAPEAPAGQLDGTLAALARADWIANAVPVGTGHDAVLQLTIDPNTFPARSSTGDVAALPITDFALQLLDDADAAAARGTLGAQPLDATLTALAGANWSLNAIPVGTGADAVSQLALAANTFPARSSAGNITAKAITDYALSLLDDPDAATARATLGAVNVAGDTMAGALNFPNGTAVQFPGTLGTASIKGLSSGVIIDNDAAIADGTTAFVYRFFRNTNTTGACALQIHVGAGLSSIQHNIDGKGTSYVCAQSGDFGVGTATPALAGSGKQFTVSNAAAAGDFVRLNLQGNTTTGTAAPATFDIYNGALAVAQWQVYRDGANDAAGMFFRTRPAGGGLTDRLIITSAGNVALFSSLASVTFGNGVGVAYLRNAATVPSANPTSGVLLYAEGGAAKCRGASGTVTTFGTADPHCPDCGSDFVHEWDNPAKYGYLAVCMLCFAEGRHSTTRTRGAWKTHD